MDVDPQVRVQLPTTDIKRAPEAAGVGGRSKVARQIGHMIEGVDQLNMILEHSGDGLMQARLPAVEHDGKQNRLLLVLMVLKVLEHARQQVVQAAWTVAAILMRRFDAARGVNETRKLEAMDLVVALDDVGDQRCGFARIGFGLACGGGQFGLELSEIQTTRLRRLGQGRLPFGAEIDLVAQQDVASARKRGGDRDDGLMSKSHAAKGPVFCAPAWGFAPSRALRPRSA